MKGCFLAVGETVAGGSAFCLGSGAFGGVKIESFAGNAGWAAENENG